jgi:hypothetical protein
METSVRAYETPAVTYEAILVAHATNSSVPGSGCTPAIGDLLNPPAGQ